MVKDLFKLFRLKIVNNRDLSSRSKWCIMLIDPPLLTLSELRNLPEDERARLRTIEESIQDRLLASLEATRKQGGDTEFVQRALVPMLLSIAARTYSEVADGLEVNSSQFVTLAQESLGWVNGRGTATPVVRH
jgi:hypothetical protein